MNNPPAFPTGIFTDDKGRIIGGSNGMTLRDYFAAKAMQGLVSIDDLDMTPSDYARWAYQQADAMLAEREKA